MQEIGTEGGLGYFSQPALAIGKACIHVAVLKQDGTVIKVDEIWVVLAGKDGFLVHDMTLPPWPGAQAADNTVERYWK